MEGGCKGISNRVSLSSFAGLEIPSSIGRNQLPGVPELIDKEDLNETLLAVHRSLSSILPLQSPLAFNLNR
jgi:hypothetical protein